MGTWRQGDEPLKIPTIYSTPTSVEFLWHHPDGRTQTITYRSGRRGKAIACYRHLCDGNNILLLSSGEYKKAFPRAHHNSIVTFHRNWRYKKDRRIPLEDVVKIEWQQLKKQKVRRTSLGIRLKNMRL